jgi:hypothetical protein
METEHLTTIPPLNDGHTAAKTALLATTALCVDYVGASGPQGPRGPKGRALKRVGTKSTEQITLLEDSYGRQYTRDHKGTIRRATPKK